jgi:tRNA pseudouridine55 synthase
MSDKTAFDFKTGEVLLVDKPLHWTSFDVVNKIRYHIKHKIGVKKIKVGHAGTLDPLADGLLILCTGKKTKTINDLMGLKKVYRGEFTLGSTTPSYDLESEIDQTYPTAHLTEEKIKEAAASMVGDYSQYPPIFSAKKVNGKKAYDLARAGKEVELQPKMINISQFDITDIDGLKVKFIISCSKGTYIRSIAHDIGKALDSGGHLSALRRDKIGDFSVQDALNVEDWVEKIDNSEMLTNDEN